MKSTGRGRVDTKRLNGFPHDEFDCSVDENERVARCSSRLGVMLGRGKFRRRRDGAARAMDATGATPNRFDRSRSVRIGR